MALWSENVTFLNLYGPNGVGYFAQDTDSGSVDDRKNCVNAAYKDVAGIIKGYWRRRSFDYTASSSPALQANVSAYNIPTTSGAVFDSAGRLYYRESGEYMPVHILGDVDWLIRSATRSADAGDPQYARIIQTSSSVRLELSRPLIQSFIDRIGTLTLEYFISIANLSADGDTTVLPRNYAHLIIFRSVWYFALGQGDEKLRKEMDAQYREAKTELLRHDITRTGRARQIRPRHDYSGARRVRRDYDYGSVD